MSAIQLGNLGEWVGAIGTLGAVWVALRIARREGRDAATNLREQLEHERRQSNQVLTVVHLTQLNQSVSKAHSIIRYMSEIAEKSPSQTVERELIRQVEIELANAEAARRVLLGLRISEDNPAAAWVVDPIPSPHDRIHIGERDIPSASLMMLVTGSVAKMGDWYGPFEEKLERLSERSLQLLSQSNLE